MAGQTYQYNLLFTADTSRAKSEVEKMAKSINGLSTLKGIDLSKGITPGLKEASKAAAEFEAMLKSAYDVKTGQLDFTKLNSDLQKSGKSVKDFANEFRKAGPEGEKVFQNVASGLQKIEPKLVRVTDLFSEMWHSLKQTARYQLSNAILGGFTRSIREAFEYSKELNASLNDIRIVTGYGVDKMAEFAVEANKAAKVLSTTTTEYTKASLIYYQQGLSDQQVKERTDITVKMANVTGETAQEVSQQMTAVWNNFYDGSKSLEYYADVLTKLGAATASSTDEISQGLEKFAATADAIGLSYEYSTAALATVTAQTRQSADVVGTAFKTMFARIQGLKLGETLDDGTTLNQYSQALAKIGVNIQDSNGNLKDMDSILNDMGEKWNGLNQAQKVATAQQVAGLRQYNQLMALMENWDFFQKNVQTAQEATGELQSQADIYAESWEAASKEVQTALEGLYQSLLKDDFFIDLTKGIAGFIEGIDKAIELLGGLQTLLPAIGSIFINVFQNKIAASLSSAALTTRNLFAGTTDVNKIKGDAGAARIQALRNDAGKSSQELSEIEHENTIARLEQKNLNTDISEQERYINSLLIERLKVLKDIAIAKAGKADSLQEGGIQGRNSYIQTMTEDYGLTKQQAGTRLNAYTSSENQLNQLENMMLTPQDAQQNAEEIANLFGQVFGDKAKIEMEEQLNALREGKIDTQAFDKKISEKRNKNKEALTAELTEEEFLSKTNKNRANKNKSQRKQLDEEGKKRYEQTKADYQEKRNNKQQFSTAEVQSQNVQREIQQNPQQPSQNDLNPIDEAEELKKKADAYANYDKALTDSAEAGQKVASAGQELNRTMKSQSQTTNENTVAQQKNNAEKDKGAKVNRNISGGLTVLASQAMAVTSAFQTFSVVSDIWSNEDLGFWEKLGSSLISLLPMVISLTTAFNKQNLSMIANLFGIKAKTAATLEDAGANVVDTVTEGGNTVATNVNTGAVIANKLARLGLVGAIIAGVAALGALVAAVVISTKKEDESEKKKKELIKTQQALNEAAEEGKEKIESLKEAWESISGEKTTLDSMIKGTKEWEEQLDSANQKVLEILKNLPELAKYITWDSETGELKLDQQGYEKYLKEKEQQAKAIEAGAAITDKEKKETEGREEIVKDTEIFAETNKTVAQNALISTTNDKYKLVKNEKGGGSTFKEKIGEGEYEYWQASSADTTLASKYNDFVKKLKEAVEVGDVIDKNSYDKFIKDNSSGLSAFQNTNYGVFDWENFKTQVIDPIGNIDTTAEDLQIQEFLRSENFKGDYNAILPILQEEYEATRKEVKFTTKAGEKVSFSEQEHGNKKYDKEMGDEYAQRIYGAEYIAEDKSGHILIKNKYTGEYIKDENDPTKNKQFEDTQYKSGLRELYVEEVFGNPEKRANELWDQFKTDAKSSGLSGEAGANVMASFYGGAKKGSLEGVQFKDIVAFKNTLENEEIRSKIGAQYANYNYTSADQFLDAIDNTLKAYEPYLTDEIKGKFTDEELTLLLEEEIDPNSEEATLEKVAELKAEAEEKEIQLKISAVEDKKTSVDAAIQTIEDGTTEEIITAYKSLEGINKMSLESFLLLSKEQQEEYLRQLSLELQGQQATLSTQQTDVEKINGFTTAEYDYLQSASNSLGMEYNTLINQVKTLRQEYKYLTTEDAVNIVSAMENQKKAISELSNTTNRDYLKVLSTASKESIEYKNALLNLKPLLAQVFNVDEAEITNEFLEQHKAAIKVLAINTDEYIEEYINKEYPIKFTADLQDLNQALTNLAKEYEIKLNIVTSEEDLRLALMVLAAGGASVKELQSLAEAAGMKLEAVTLEDELFLNPETRKKLLDLGTFEEGKVWKLTTEEGYWENEVPGEEEKVQTVKKAKYYSDLDQYDRELEDIEQRLKNAQKEIDRAETETDKATAEANYVELLTKREELLGKKIENAQVIYDYTFNALGSLANLSDSDWQKHIDGLQEYADTIADENKKQEQLNYISWLEHQRSEMLQAKNIIFEETEALESLTEEEKERLKTLREQNFARASWTSDLKYNDKYRRSLEEIQLELENLDDAKSRAYGADKLDIIAQEEEWLQKELETYQKIGQEIQDNTNLAKADLKEVIKATAENNSNYRFSDFFNFETSEFDVDKTKEYIQAEINKYKEAIATTVSEDQKKKLEEERDEFLNVAETILNLEESIYQYSIDLKENFQNVEKTQDAILDKDLESIKTKFEIKIEVDERELRNLEYRLGKLDEANPFAAKDFIYADLRKLEITYEDIAEQRKILEDIEKRRADGEFNDNMQLYWDERNEAEETLIGYLEEQYTLSQSIEQSLANALSNIKDLINGELSKFDSLDELLTHYETSLELLNRDKEYQTIIKLTEASMENALAELELQKRTLAALEPEKEALEKTLAAMSPTDENYWNIKTQLDQITDLYNDTNSKILSLIEEAAEKANKILETKMEEAADTFNRAISGEVSIDSFINKLDLMTEAQEKYFDKTNQIYETNALLRKAQQAFDKTDSKMAKEKLLGFSKTVEQLKNQNKLSKFELEAAQKRFEILQAEIALKDAEDAKSQVRLMRNAAGGYSYVFTADEEAAEEARQNLDDKNNDYYNFLKDSRADAEKEWYENALRAQEAIAEVDQNWIDGMYKTEQEYEDERAKVQSYWTDRMYQDSKTFGLILEANGEDVSAADEMWRTFKSNFDTYMDSNTTSITEWKNDTAFVLDEIGKNSEETSLKIKSVTEAGDALAEELNTTLFPALDIELKKIQDLVAEYDKLKASKEALVKQAEWDTTEDGKGFGYDDKTDYMYEAILAWAKGDTADAKLLAAQRALKLNAKGEEAIKADKKEKLNQNFLLNLINTQVQEDDKNLAEELEAIGAQPGEIMNKLIESGYPAEQHEDLGNIYDAAYYGCIDVVNKADELGVELDEAYKENTNWLIENEVEFFGAQYTTLFGKLEDIKGLIASIEISVPDWDDDEDDGWKEKDGGGTDGEDDGEDGGTEGDGGGDNNVKPHQNIDQLTDTEKNKTANALRNYQDRGNKLSPSQQATLDALEASGYATGGYTGSWGSEGRLAFLHQKELVLNAHDTENMLDMISIVRDFSKAIDMQALMAAMPTQLSMASRLNPERDKLQQQVSIQATFPNVQDHNEIEEAFNNLINTAAQYANR